jgi:hypothetical protein
VSVKVSTGAYGRSIAHMLRGFDFEPSPIKVTTETVI